MEGVKGSASKDFLGEREEEKPKRMKCRGVSASRMEPV